jgi:hypothetical protein
MVRPATSTAGIPVPASVQLVAFLARRMTPKSGDAKLGLGARAGPLARLASVAWNVAFDLSFVLVAFANHQHDRTCSDHRHRDEAHRSEKRRRPRTGGLSAWAGESASPWKRAGVAMLTRPLILAAAALAAFVLVYPMARDRIPRLDLLHNRAPAADQSASQLSSEEFDRIGNDFTPSRLRSFAGEPATKTRALVEGVRLDCWYYGVAGARGAYQICFENGGLSTKTRYG